MTPQFIALLLSLLGNCVLLVAWFREQYRADYYMELLESCQRLLSEQEDNYLWLKARLERISP